MSSFLFFMKSVLSGKTIYRALQNQILRDIPFQGSILDVAGGDGSSSYRCLIDSRSKSLNLTTTWTVADYMPSHNVDLVFDAKKKWPNKPNKYDNVLIVNALYIFRDYNHIMEEAFKSLKVGGRLVIGSPFIWPECPEPTDYFRHTQMGLKNIVLDNGFRDVEIIAFGGRFTCAVDIIRPYLVKICIFSLFATMALILDRLLSESSQNTRLGFVVVCYK